jgi:nitrogen fixation protein FixH
MNWGHKITIIFVAFAGMMIYMVVRSFQANVDLVTEDYYIQELNFQQQIDKTKNVKADQKEVSHRLTIEGVELQFSEKSTLSNLEGNINIYRPSEADMDKSISIALDSQMKQMISPEFFIPGKYILKIDWKEGETPYYQEIELMVPGA